MNAKKPANLILGSAGKMNMLNYINDITSIAPILRAFYAHKSDFMTKY
jgi:hypothetical protein